MKKNKFYYGSNFYKKVALRMSNSRQALRLEDLLKIFLDVRGQEGGDGSEISKAQTYKIMNVLRDAVCSDGVTRWSKRACVFKNDHGVEKKGFTYKIIPFDRNMMLKSIDSYFNRVSEGSNHREKQIKALKKELGLNNEAKKEEKKPMNTGYSHFLISRLRELYAEDYRKQQEYSTRNLPVPEEIRNRIYKDRKELEIAYPQDNIPQLDDFITWLKIALCARYLNKSHDRIGVTVLKRRGISQKAYKTGFERFEKFDLGIPAVMSGKSIIFSNLEEAIEKIKTSISLFYGIEGEKLANLVSQCTPDKKDWLSEKQKQACKRWYDKKKRSEPQSTAAATTKKAVKDISIQIRDYIIRVTAGLIGRKKNSPKSVKISDIADIFEFSGLSTVLDHDQLKSVLEESVFEVKGEVVELKPGISGDDVKKKHTKRFTFTFATVFNDFQPRSWMKSVESVAIKGETKIFRITCDHNVRTIVSLVSWYSGLKPGYEVIVDEDLAGMLKKISSQYKIESILSPGNQKRLQNDMILFSID